MDYIHGAAILELNRGLGGWVLKLRTNACDSKFTQACYTNGSCALPLKLHLNSKVAVAWKESIESSRVND